MFSCLACFLYEKELMAFYCIIKDCKSLKINVDSITFIALKLALYLLPENTANYNNSSKKRCQNTFQEIPSGLF